MKIILTCDVDEAQLERFNAKRKRLGVQTLSAFDLISQKAAGALMHLEEVVPASVQVREVTQLEEIIESMALDPTLKYSMERGIRQVDPDANGNEQFEPTEGRTLTLHSNGGATKCYIPCPLTVVEPTHGTEYSVTHRPCQLHAGHKGLCF